MADRLSDQATKRHLPPVVNSETRLLVLGSLPGDASLAAARYYAHPRNLFWRLLGEALDQPLEPLPYEARLQMLLERGIGLWDTVAEARRRGSLDGAIRDAVAADLPALVARLPRLRTVAFNGAAAARTGVRSLAAETGRLELLTLPSSSPANAAVPYERKREAWRALGARLA